MCVEDCTEQGFQLILDHVENLESLENVCIKSVAVGFIGLNSSFSICDAYACVSSLLLSYAYE